jgi:hypothetical protein
MGLIPMIQWIVIEILQKFQKVWIRLRIRLEVIINSDHLSLACSPLEVGLNMERKNNAMVSLFQGKVGFRYIMETNWKLPSGFPPFFLPCLR